MKDLSLRSLSIRHLTLLVVCTASLVACNTSDTNSFPQVEPGQVGSIDGSQGITDGGVNGGFPSDVIISGTPEDVDPLQPAEDASIPDQDAGPAPEQDIAEPDASPPPVDGDGVEPPDSADIDSPSASCEGICGQQAPSGCWCDDGCTERGACCDDAALFCPPAPPNPNACDSADDCEDGGQCDVAQCADGTCVYTPGPGECDDGDPCTELDMCSSEGVCIGEPVDCDDGVGCTADSCDDGECIHAPIGSSCELNLSITFPSRGASLTGSSSVTVTGMVDAPFGVQSLTISGQDVAVAADGYFEMTYPALHGLNLIEAELVDNNYNEMVVNQSFLYASSYHPPGSSVNVTKIPAGSGAWFASSTFDDGDLDDLDDIKALAWLILTNFDLASVIPSPLLEGDEAPSAAGCTWEVTVSNIAYTLNSLTIEPGYGALNLGVVYEDISADISAVAPNFWCPDAEGDVAVDDLTVAATLTPQVQGSEVIINITNTSVVVAEPEVTLNGITGFLLNWVVNFFEDDLGMMVEEEIVAIIETEIAPLLKSALSQISDFSIDFTVPGFQGTPDAEITLVAEPEAVELEPTGLAIEVNLGVASQQVISHASPGSIGRSTSCPNNASPLDSLPHANGVEAFAVEDFFNQLLFASWRAGQMQFALDESQFGDIGANVGFEDMSITLDPHLPPVVTTCDTGPTSPLELQLGDVLVNADFTMLGVEQSVSLYLSLKIDLWLDLVGSNAGEAQVLASVGEVKALAVHLMTTDTSDVVDLFLDETFLESVILDAFVGGFLSDVWSAIPIPAVDLGNFIPGIPEGVVLTLMPQTLAIQGNHATLGGLLIDQ